MLVNENEAYMIIYLQLWLIRIIFFIILFNIIK